MVSGIDSTRTSVLWLARSVVVVAVVLPLRALGDLLVLGGGGRGEEALGAVLVQVVLGVVAQVGRAHAHLHEANATLMGKA